MGMAADVANPLVLSCYSFLSLTAPSPLHLYECY